MTVEAATYVNQLNASHPMGSEDPKEGDNHIVRIKETLLNSFPNVGGVVSATHGDLSALAGAATTGASPKVTTATAGDNTSAAASTAFVQAALAALSAGSWALTIVTSASTTPTLARGQITLCTNASAVTAALPTSPAAGWVTGAYFENARTDNVVGRSSSNIERLAENLNVDSAYRLLVFMYMSATTGWKLIGAV